MLCTRCLRQGYFLLRTYATTTTSPQAAAGSKPLGRGDEGTSVMSGTLAGTPLKNINYFKSRVDPVALEDHEYPEWLWRCLDGPGAKAEGENEDQGDLYSKSKKVRRTAAKRAAKAAALEALDPEIRVPIDEQTLDLPFATTPSSSSSAPSSSIKKLVSAVGGISSKVKTQTGPKGVAAKKPTTIEIGDNVQVTFEEAQRAREEVNKEQRRKRRAHIKEQNYLNSM